MTDIWGNPCPGDYVPKAVALSLRLAGNPAIDDADRQAIDTVVRVVAELLEATGDAERWLAKEVAGSRLAVARMRAERALDMIGYEDIKALRLRHAAEVMSETDTSRATFPCGVDLEEFEVRR